MRAGRENSMTRETITVKVSESDMLHRTQTVWQRILGRFCERLVSSNHAISARLQVVFPDHANPAMASLFTIEIESTQEGLAEPLENLTALPGIEFAHIASARRSMTRSMPMG
jgi:hypothetical protein